MSKDQDPAVRREVGIALRDVPFEQAAPAIKNLVSLYDGKDPWMLEAIGTAASGKEKEVYQLVKANDTSSPEKWSEKRSNLTWRLHPGIAVSELKIRAGSDMVSTADRRKTLTALGFINTREAVDAMISLSKSKLPDVSSLAAWWLNFRKTNDWADLADWDEEMAVIITPEYKKMLELKKTVSEKNSTLPDRISAAQKMAEDKNGGNILLDMRVQGQVPDTIAKSVSETMFKNPDQNVRVLASQFFPREGKMLKTDFIARMQGSAQNGEKLFKTNCASCHKHGEDGADIGPDLTAIQKKFDKAGLLDAIVNPSASIVFGYEAYTITTKKGDTFFGFLLSDGANVVLKDVAGIKHTIKADQIKRREKMAKSLMPEPTALGLTEQNLADISGYLLSF